MIASCRGRFMVFAKLVRHRPYLPLETYVYPSQRLYADNAPAKFTFLLSQVLRLVCAVANKDKLSKQTYDYAMSQCKSANFKALHSNIMQCLGNHHSSQDSTLKASFEIIKELDDHERA